jgi:hypothetical protein
MATSIKPDLFGHVPADPPPTRRSRITNDPTSARCDRSTAAGRRLADLFRMFLQEVANPGNPFVQNDALRAASPLPPSKRALDCLRAVTTRKRSFDSKMPQRVP